MAKLSEGPIGAFRLNIRKAFGLTHLQFAIDDILETGGERTLGIFMQRLDEFYVKTLGVSFEELSKPQESILDLEIQKKVDSIPKEERDAKAAVAIQSFKPVLDLITVGLEDVDLLRRKTLNEQAVVLAVTALEVYCSDATASAVELNEFIEKRFYQELNRELRYEHLASLEYEGRKTLGSVVASSYRFYDMESLSNHFKRMLGTDLFGYDSHERRNLQTMIDYRNLIIHQAGIVDQSFIAETGYTGKKGGAVELNRVMVEGWLKFVEDLAQKIDESIRSLVEPSSGESESASCG